MVQIGQAELRQPFPKAEFKEEKSVAQINCEQKGGRWINNSCVMPGTAEAEASQAKVSKLKEIVTPPPSPFAPPAQTLIPKQEEAAKLTQPVYKDYDNFSTVELPDGRKMLFKDKDEARAFVEKQVPLPQPAGTMTPEQLEQQQELKRLAGQVGQFDPSLAQATGEAPTDYGQALTAGLAGSIPGAITGASAGLAAGLAGGPLAPVSVPVGVAIGTIGGGLASVWRGVQSNIEQQKRGEIRASVDVLSAARTNMRQLAMLASRDPGNADIFIQQYNLQLAQVHKAHSQVKLETQGNLNSYIEDGTDILSDFELFLDPQIGTASIYGKKLIGALETGVPIELTEDDLPI